jgi:hypothetical protein
VALALVVVLGAGGFGITRGLTAEDTALERCMQDFEAHLRLYPLIPPPITAENPTAYSICKSYLRD